MMNRPGVNPACYDLMLLFALICIGTPIGVAIGLKHGFKGGILGAVRGFALSVVTYIVVAVLSTGLRWLIDKVKSRKR